MRLLLTGPDGQVGSELRRSLAPLGEVIALSRAELDLSDAGAIRAAVREHRPDWIVNAGAYTAVDKAESEPALAQAVNGDAPTLLAQEADRLKARLLHYSTDYVFDGTSTRPYQEDDPTNPVSAYGRSKLAGERAVLASSGGHLVLRTSWVYAARGRNFLLTMLRLAKERPELRVVNDQYGAPTWSRDIAAASADLIRLQAGRGSPVGPALYHLECGGTHHVAPVRAEDRGGRGPARTLPPGAGASHRHRRVPHAGAAPGQLGVVQRAPGGGLWPEPAELGREPAALPGRGGRMKAYRWLVLALAGVLAACGHGKPGEEGDKRGPELAILASPEVRNLEFLGPRMEAAAGRHIRFDYAGTVEMADRLRAGAVADFAWPADGLYIAFNAPGRVLSAENIARSPVVLGLKKTRAEELGWDRKAPSWEEIAKAAAKEDLALGMADPVASNLGLSALLSAVLATSHNLHPQSRDISHDLNVPVLKSLYSSMKLLGGSGTWLAESYVKQEDRLDGMINYESAVLELNAGADLDTPLAVIHPRDGVMVADHPLLLLNAAQRPAYDKLTAFLRSPAVQREIMDKTWRRPVSPEVKPGPLFGQHLPRSMPESLGLDFVRDVLDAYQGQIRPPAHSYFVLDVSGSMAQEHRMDELKARAHRAVGLRPGHPRRALRALPAAREGQSCHLQQRDRAAAAPGFRRSAGLRAGHAGLRGLRRATGAQGRHRPLRRAACGVRPSRQGPPPGAGLLQQHRAAQRRPEQQRRRLRRLREMVRRAAGHRPGHPGLPGAVRRAQPGRDEAARRADRRASHRRHQSSLAEALKYVRGYQ